MGDTIDHEAARREAQRLVDEYPKLVQPNETTTNLARAYLDLARKAVPREPTGKMWSDGLRAFRSQAEKYHAASSTKVADIYADVSPAIIWREMWDAYFASQAPQAMTSTAEEVTDKELADWLLLLKKESAGNPFFAPWGKFLREAAYRLVARTATQRTPKVQP